MLRVGIIEVWHGFTDYNYLSLTHQLIPIIRLQVMMTITENDKMTNYIVKLQVKLVLNRFERGKWVQHFMVQWYIGEALLACFVVHLCGMALCFTLRFQGSKLTA